MPSPVQLEKAILLALAAAGFLFGFYQWHITRRAKPPSAVTRLQIAYLTYGPRLSEGMLLVRVVNSGEKPMRVTAIELAFEDSVIWFTGGIEGTENLPFDLPQSRNAEFWIPIAELQRELHSKNCRGRVGLRAIARDAMGNTFESAAVELDMDRDYQ